jgi:hypothetical protein
MIDNNWSGPLMDIRRLVKAASDHASLGSFAEAQLCLHLINHWVIEAEQAMGAEQRRREALERKGTR